VTRLALVKLHVLDSEGQDSLAAKERGRDMYQV
jgi:hypothetical protein